MFFSSSSSCLLGQNSNLGSKNFFLISDSIFRCINLPHLIGSGTAGGPTEPNPIPVWVGHPPPSKTAPIANSPPESADHSVRGTCARAYTLCPTHRYPTLQARSLKEHLNCCMVPRQTLRLILGKNFPKELGPNSGTPADSLRFTNGDTKA